MTASPRGVIVNAGEQLCQFGWVLSAALTVFGIAIFQSSVPSGLSLATSTGRASNSCQFDAAYTASFSAAGRRAAVYRCNTVAPPSLSPSLDFDASEPYTVGMTKLLDEALEAVRRLPSADQDDIARAIMQLAGSDPPRPVVLSPEEREAIARSKAAAGRGEFATDEQVRAVWAKHGL
jgi:hypothetical protein